MRTIHREIVGTFIFSNDGHLLLGKSRKGGVYKGSWVIPGGGMEEGETQLEAAKRETLEEVGIDITEFEVRPMDIALTGQSEKVLRETSEKVLVDMTFHNFSVHADKPASDIAISCEDDLAEASWHQITDLHKLSLPAPTETTLRTLGYL